MTDRRFLQHLPLRSESAAAAHGLACPTCGSAVFRVSRRAVDLLASIFVPLRRYRCIAMKCAWEGNLREKPISLPRCDRAIQE